MSAKPILFSGPMVRALLEGRKTQTRRVLKPQPHAGLRHSVFVPSGVEDGHGREIKVRYQPGDVLWVRETWAVAACSDGLAPANLSPRFHQLDGGVWYPADDTVPAASVSKRGKTRVSIHMPRWASRLTLEVKSVKVERLQDISEADAVREGCTFEALKRGDVPAGADPKHSFLQLWDSINGAGAWSVNPWVVALTFTVCKRNVDAMIERAAA